jgi:probable rRNA maturation factor
MITNVALSALSSLRIAKMRPQTKKVFFHFQNPGFSLPHRSAIKVALLRLCRREKLPVESLHFIFCTDLYLRKINQKFLQHTDYTDIITFNYAESGLPVQAELYISVDRIRENAKSYLSPFRKELVRVMFHGLLHLCGYSDKGQKAAIQMREKEDFYLRLK